MNRRQFLACSLSGAIASAALPWDPFLEWCKRWLGFVRDKAKSQLTSFAELMKQHYSSSAIEELLYAPSPLMQMLEAR